MSLTGQLYPSSSTSGKLQPSQKFMNVLSAWKSGGIDAVRGLVQRGLAPAAILGVFSGMQAASQGDSAM